ncbi:MAG: hypothetical protein K0V04_44645 [Deltaproteobacteria bacterium]|nr:hypothetical protein [Deltaproteobacteria bacterium]
MGAEACKGSFCNYLSVECTTTNNNPAPHTCTWSGWFSEEDPDFLAPSGQAIKGVQCSGSNCDDKRYWYCPIP